MIIDIELDKLKQLKNTQEQWEFDESNGLTLMQDNDSKIWVLRNKLLFGSEEEAYRLRELHESILKRFHYYTGLELPKTYFVDNEGDLTYLSEKIEGSGILEKLSNLINLVNNSTGLKKIEAQSQLDCLTKTLEALYLSLFDYFLNSFHLNIPCLCDMKLDQLVITDSLCDMKLDQLDITDSVQIHFIDFDPDFGNISNFFNFFGNLRNLENLLSQTVYDYLCIKKIIGSPDWGIAFIQLVESYGYSIDYLNNLPITSQRLQTRISSLKNGNDIYREDLTYRDWEI